MFSCVASDEWMEAGKELRNENKTIFKKFPGGRTGSVHD